MAARKKATRKKGATRKKQATRKKRARRDQSARRARTGSPRAARVRTGGVGKPRVELDLEKLEEMAGSWLSHDAIASLLDISRQTLQERIVDTPAVAEAIARGRANRENDLRIAQWAVAHGGCPASPHGNPTMLIWLGKNYLGQSDKIVHASDPDAPVMGDLGDALTAKLIEYITHRRRSADTADAGEGRD